MLFRSRLPAGWLPVALCALGAIGMLWASVPMAERLDGFKSFIKLLFIPLLMLQFRRSEHGSWVLVVFLISCTTLLALSWILKFAPQLAWWPIEIAGVPVKDYLAQGAEFMICALLLADWAILKWNRARWRDTFLILLLMSVFLLNLLFVTFNRTILVVLPVLIVLFSVSRFKWRGAVAIIVSAFVLLAIAWPFSEPLRRRVLSFKTEVQAYGVNEERTSAGERLEFYKKSIGFVSSAPIIGHGTGSIRELFRQSTMGQSGIAAVASANPHNQTLGVAIQLGLLGVMVLFAMWIAHVLLFRATGIAAWIGMVVVVQNLVSSLFNSHLFDFTHGWLYVVGVGIAAGTVLYERAAEQGGAAP